MEILKIIDKLKSKREVFYSERDFQFALAWEIQEHYKNANVDVRLEYPNLQGKEYIDIIVQLENKTYPIELKYKTLSFWNEHTQSSTVTVKNENYNLKNQSAQDFGKYYYLKDIQRIEKFLKDNVNYECGYAILLTNDKLYWTKNKPENIDAQFSISEEEIKTGKLKWREKTEDELKKGREKDIELDGEYKIKWNEYSEFNGVKNGKFRYCLNTIKKS